MQVVLSGASRDLHYIAVTLQTVSDACMFVTDIVLFLRITPHNAVAVGEYGHFHYGPYLLPFLAAALVLRGNVDKAYQQLVH
jgi:hypothetical protein